MKLLYSGNTLLEQWRPFPKELEQEQPVDLLLSAVLELNSMACGQPAVCLTQDEDGVLLLYRQMAWAWRDVTEQLGGALAAISSTWPASVYGATAHREIAELNFVRSGELYCIQIHTASEREFDVLSGLMLQVLVKDHETAGKLQGLCSALSCGDVTASIGRQYESFLQNSRLICATPGSAFLYHSWAESQPQQLLACLDLEKKRELWRIFLHDAGQPLEFSWLWDAYCMQTAAHLLEWTLALQLVLQELGFTVERQERQFWVLDGGQRRVQFDFLDGGPAEKVFLKLLFPLDNK